MFGLLVRHCCTDETPWLRSNCETQGKSLLKLSSFFSDIMHDLIINCVNKSLLLMKKYRNIKHTKKTKLSKAKLIIRDNKLLVKKCTCNFS